MIFLNPYILLGLSAMAIPIVIHLLNRRRAQVVEWGAMRFLVESLAARSRRVKIEEIALLALRCLVPALAVLAAARPFLPSRPAALAVLMTAALPAAAVALAAAGVVWSNRRLRYVLLGIAGLLLILGPAGGAFERWRQTRLWNFADGQKDVAIVIDGSMSMSLPAVGGGAGETNFDRALSEARAVVNACGPGDGVSLIVASAVPRVIVGSPSADRAAVLDALDGLSQPGGSLRTAPAISAAIRSLRRGSNPAGKIVLITDGQKVGWDVREAGTWRTLGRSLRQRTGGADVIVRTLGAPGELTNAAITDIRLDRRLIGVAREAQIDVHLRSTGTNPVPSAELRLLLDGEVIASRNLESGWAGGEVKVSFRHRFDNPGRHVLAARLDVLDDMPGDNEAVRIVDVRSSLGVLVIDGADSDGLLESAADFIETALSVVPGRTSQAGGGAKTKPEPHRPAAKPLMKVKVLAAPDAGRVLDGKLDAYAAVVLADVPLLSKKQADKLAAYVAAGGGLLLAPGPRSRPEFYAGWRHNQMAVAPARLAKWNASADDPARLSPATFTHPALASVAADGSDAGRALLTAWWRLKADPNDPGVGVAGLLDTGEPLLVEREFGKGRVLMLAGALDARSGNLPTLSCFVPLLHETFAYLAEPGLVEPNGRLGQDVVIALSGAGGQHSRGQQLETIAPSGATRRAVVISTGPEPRVRLAKPREPGTYRLVLPPDVARSCAAMCPDANGVPFVVTDTAEESAMALLTDADLDAARTHVRAGMKHTGLEREKILVRVETADELQAAVAGTIPGVEIWRYVAVGLLLALVAEVALTRWIAARRSVRPYGKADLTASSRMSFDRAAPGLAADREIAPPLTPTSETRNA